MLKLWLAPFDTPRRGIEPIAPWRGLPVDRSPVPGRGGLHDGFSWLSADEILAALPLLERWTQTLTEEEFQKQRLKAYWEDATFAPWIESAPKLVSAQRKPGTSAEPEKFEVEFVLDISAEVQEFIDKVLELKSAHGDLRFVFEYA